MIFIRRCGLRRLAPRIRQFNIDGALLMTFDLEDFLLLGHADSVNAKRVRFVHICIIYIIYILIYYVCMLIEHSYNQVTIKTRLIAVDILQAVTYPA